MTFIIPLVIQDIHAATSILAIDDGGPHAIGDSESEDEDSDTPTVENSDIESLNKAFKRMEKEVVTKG